MKAIKCQGCGHKVGEFGGVVVKRWDEEAVWLRPASKGDNIPLYAYGCYHWKCLTMVKKSSHYDS